MANPEVKPYPETLYRNLQKMDRALEYVVELRKGPRSLEEDQIYHDQNRQAFEGFYDATRTLTRNEDGNLEVSVNPEVVSIASGRLLQRGIAQFVKHQPLANFDLEYSPKHTSKLP